MKINYLFGLISGITMAVFLMCFGFRKCYVFVGPAETWVHVDGLRESFKIEQFSEVNDFLKNAPGGRIAFVYPTSSSSYAIVYLPKNNRNMDEIERKRVSKIISEMMRN